MAYFSMVIPLGRRPALVAMALSVTASLSITMAPWYFRVPASPGLGVDPSRVYQMSAPAVGVERLTAMGSRLVLEAGLAVPALTVSGGGGGAFCQFTAIFREANTQWAVSKATTSMNCDPSTMLSGVEKV